MANSYISGLSAAGALTGEELLEVSQPSATVTITATTISAQASDNSFNDSGNGFAAAGFEVGDRVRVTGFTGSAANNLVVGTITVLTAGKMTIGGTDGDVIVDDAAGESVTITKWETHRTTAQEIADLASGSGGGGGSNLTPPNSTALSIALNSPTVIDHARAMVLTGAAASGVLRGRLESVPSGDFDAVIKVSGRFTGAFNSGGLIFRDTGGKYLVLGIGDDSSSVPTIFLSQWSAHSTFNADATKVAFISGTSFPNIPLFLRFSRDGSTDHLTASYSYVSEEGPWQPVGSENSYLGTIDAVGVFINCNNVTAPGVNFEHYALV